MDFTISYHNHCLFSKEKEKDVSYDVGMGVEFVLTMNSKLQSTITSVLRWKKATLSPFPSSWQTRGCCALTICNLFIVSKQTLSAQAPVLNRLMLLQQLWTVKGGFRNVDFIFLSMEIIVRALLVLFLPNNQRVDLSLRSSVLLIIHVKILFG